MGGAQVARLVILEGTFQPCQRKSVFSVCNGCIVARSDWNFHCAFFKSLLCFAMARSSWRCGFWLTAVLRQSSRLKHERYRICVGRTRRCEQNCVCTTSYNVPKL